MHIKKILLAEDDVDDQHLFFDFLHHRKDIVLMPVAENGVELLDRLEHIEHPDDLPDLIILDQNMPKKNGLQTLQILKSSSKFAHIPVMMYSTYADQQLFNDSAELGATLTMSKPITRDGYNEMIDAFLHILIKPA